jgi:hypothetical protein
MHENDRLTERLVSALIAAPTIYCIECCRPWLVASERWRMKVLEEIEGPETVPYCPDCFEREFGADF